MLSVIHTQGDDTLARVYIAELADGAKIEFVESIQPPIPRDQKWVLIVSTLKGCPVGCPICDAGGDYRGKLSSFEIIAQIDEMIRRRYPDLVVPIPKLKIQFARMGDPVLNDAVLEVLSKLPEHITAPGLLPCISTVAPAGCDGFFESLITIKEELYTGGRFQMQFSLHTTDADARSKLVPVKTWSLEQMATYGNRFYRAGDRKITLNFAPAQGLPLDPESIIDIFSPDRFMIKLTPINPTSASHRAGLTGLIDPAERDQCRRIVDRFRGAGYDTLLSIGEARENTIGSNCGMYVARMEQEKKATSPVR